MYLLFDVGGTKIRVSVSRDGKTLLGEPKVISTPQDFIEGISAIKIAAQEISAGEKIDAACGGVPGPLDKEKTKIVSAPNLPQWNERPLNTELEKALGAKVFLENDAALAGLGEAHFGAGQGSGIIAYLTISTGVGGSRIVNGVIDENAMGFEPGHQLLGIEGSRDLESYIGGGAIEKQQGKRPYEITDEKFWNEIARLLAYGLHNTIVHWSPDVVVLGGSMMKSPGIKASDAMNHLSRIMKIFPEIPPIKKAELGDFSGLYGAIVLLNQKSRK